MKFISKEKEKDFSIVVLLKKIDFNVGKILMKVVKKDEVFEVVMIRIRGKVKVEE